MKKKVDPVVDEAVETLNMKDGPSRRRLLEGAGLFSATAAASALIAACTSSSTSSATSTSTASPAIASGGHNPFPALPTQQYYFNNHASTNEFFTPTKYGYADAATLLGIPAPIWGGSPTSADSQMIAFMNTAISAKAAGIATSVIDSSMTTPVANAMNAGIPVVTYNSDGIYKNGVPEIYTNRLAYVGQPLYVSGQIMGEQIKSLVPGGGEIAIFIATPGTGNIQPRYDGAVSVLGSSYHVSEIGTTTVDSTELSTEKSYILGHKSTVKGVFAVDSGSTANLYEALNSTGMAGKIPAGGFDTDPRTLNGLKAGTIQFSIFQDPYLQGFLPTLYLYLYNLSGAQLTPPDTDTSLTVLTPSNVGGFLKPSRYQGGSSAQMYLPRPAGPIHQPVATTSS
jgi:simple sugar transport system substrate-binding protein